MKRLAAAFVLCLAWSGSLQAQIVVHQPWVRSTVPGQTVAGAFMRISSAGPAALVGVSSPAAKRAEIHATTMDKEIARMRPVARMELPAGKTVELKPGGHHVMLVGILKPLAKGDTVPLSLSFERPGRPLQIIEVNAEVRDVMAGGGAHGTQ